MKLGDESEFVPREEDLKRFESIHEKVFPADVRVSERILARLRLRGETPAPYRDVRVWRISPLGIELIGPKETMSFGRGDSVDLEVVVVGQRSLFEGLVVDVVESDGDMSILGLRLSKRETPIDGDKERRHSVRWICSEEFLPAAVAPVPGRFDDFMYFKVRDISKGGLQLSTSLRNKFLLKGMRLSLTIGFPMGSVVSIDVSIARIGLARFGAEDRLVLGTSFLEISSLAKRVLGQYLVQFTSAESLSAIQEAGFMPDSVARGTNFYYLKSEEDFRAVLNLRLAANQRANQVGISIATPEDTGDMNDMKSRILVAKRNDEIIGTARFRFPQLDEPLEYERFIAWPKSLPRRDEVIEVSRLATDSRFRTSDLLVGMFKYACSTCITPERPWLVMSCMEKYKPFYTKIGFQDAELSYTDPHWSEPLHVMVNDSYGTLRGEKAHPLYWNLIWKEVADFMIENGLVTLTSRDRARMFVYRLLSPFSRLMVDRLRSRKKR